MPQANSNRQTYNPVTAGNGRAEAAAVAPWAVEGDTTGPAIVGGFLCLLFVGGSIFYGQHCAQVYANQIHGTVYWSPYLAAVLAMLGLFSQVCLMSLPFHMCFQGPVIRRYREDGVHTWARVLRREATNQGKTRIYKMVLVYRLPAAVYTKKFSVKEEEFQKQQFPIVVLPGVPTSAIMEKTYDSITGNCGQFACRAIFGLLSPLAWSLAFFYGYQMEAYSQNDAWTQWGLALLFFTSFVSSIFFAYCMIVSETKGWVHGGACRVDTSRLPEGFLEELKVFPGEACGQLKDDTESTLDSSLELI